MNRFFISPYDTLLFRSSRPFNKGLQNNTAEFGNITPRPFFGMLRSFLLLSICNKERISLSELNNIKENNVPESLNKIKNLLEDIGHPFASKNGISNLSIKGIFLCNKKGEELFPFPKDIIKIIHNDNTIKFSKSIPKESITHNLIKQFNKEMQFGRNSVQNLFIGSNVKNSEIVEANFITKQGFIYYLNNEIGKIKENDVIYPEQLPYNIEWQIGIEIDNSSYTTKEHMLYRSQKIRFKEENSNKAGFILWYDDNKITNYFNKIKENNPERKIFTGKLGGENKTIYLKKIRTIDMIFEKAINNIEKQSKSKMNFEKVISNIEENKRFFIYLATPAIFVRNDKVDWKPNIEKIAEITGLDVNNLTFLGGLLDKPLLVGGFDTVKRRPLPMRRMVPAGSVYFYKYENGSIHSLKDWPINISDYNNVNKEGFGLSFIGGY